MCRRGVLAFLLLACGGAELCAQFYPGPGYPGVPVVVPSGIGFSYRGSRLRVSGFFSTGYSVGYLPAPGFYPGPSPLPFAPGFPIPTSGYIDSRVSYTVIAPTVTLIPRAPLPLAPVEADLSGVDLEVSPSPLKLYESKRIIKTEGKLLDLKPKELVPPPVPVKEKEEKFKPIPIPKAEFPVPKKEDLSPLGQGLTAFSTGEYGLAAFHFHEAILADPSAGRPLFLLAQTFVAQGKFRAAVDTIHKGLKNAPDFPVSLFNPRAELYKGVEEEYELQRKLLDDLVTEDPKNGPYLFLQGYLTWFEGRRDEARKIFVAARLLAPDPWFVDQFLKAP